MTRSHVKYNDFNIILQAYVLQLMNIFQHVQCRRNNVEMILGAEIILFRFQTWLHVK